MKRAIIISLLFISGVVSAFGQVPASDDDMKANVVTLVKEHIDVLGNLNADSATFEA